MTVKTPTYYQVACDEPGCTTTTADLGEFSAWAERVDAVNDWLDHDMQRGSLPGGGELHFCDAHRKPECDNCDDGVIPDASAADGAEERLCAVCRATEDS